MSSRSIPPDPYKVLGVDKLADAGDIRTAYRKLILKCHPDKVQDAALKAIKSAEFQKVQQAYELLSNDDRRTAYDNEVKLFELRSELGRNGQKIPTKNGPYGAYEVRTAEPRTSTFKSTSPSYEDELGARYHEEPLKGRAKKSVSSEDRKRTAARDEEKEKWRKAEDDRERERREKEAKRSEQSAAKKARDKLRRRRSEEKFTRSAYVVDDDSDEAYRPRAEKKSSRRSEDELRARDAREAREELTRAAERLRKEEQHLTTERTRKLDAHKDFAAQYMQAARRKADPEADYRPKPIRRAETFQEPSYTARYASQPIPTFVDDEDLPRRSSARRTSEQIPIRSREPPRSSEKDRKGSPSYEPFIVDAAPPSPQTKAPPPLKSHSSAPPKVTSRKEPHRSKTMDSSRKHSAAPTPPTLPRASTFQSGDRGKPARGSKLKKAVEYSSDESDSEGAYGSPRAITPPPRRRDPSPVRYVIEKGRSIPLNKPLNNRHRSELREADYDDPRDRSESPRGGRHSTERPSPMRTGSSGAQSFARPAYYGGAPTAEPIIKEVRPKMAPRESSTRSSSNRGPYFGEVKYAPNYGPEHVSYTPVDAYRRGSDPSQHRDYAYPPRPSAYA